MSSDLLRRAAAKLRETAKAATPGPWRAHDTDLGRYGHAATVLSGEGNETDLRAWLPSFSHEPWDQLRNVWDDAAYIALMSPPVALALADVLDSHGRAMITAGATRDERLEAVARAVLREDGEQR